MLHYHTAGQRRSDIAELVKKKKVSQKKGFNPTLWLVNPSKCMCLVGGLGGEAFCGEMCQVTLMTVASMYVMSYFEAKFCYSKNTLISAIFSVIFYHSDNMTLYTRNTIVILHILHTIRY